MKVQFNASDNIYKIFKTIKKIPANKQVFIFIDAQNSFFAHSRWGLQLKDLLKQQRLKAVCIATTAAQKIYFEQVALPYVLERGGNTSLLQRTKEFLFSTKSAHQKLLFKKNFISYLIILSELAVIGLVIYLFRGMISPNATITIKPSFEVEPIVYSFYMYPQTAGETQISETHLSLPYQLGELPYEHEMTVDVENLQVFIEDAQGRVEIFNTLPTDLSLVGNTTLVTDDGLVYRTATPVNIPAGSTETPGRSFANVIAQSYQENGLAIGERGNIPKDTTLRIKNLPESMEQKRIFAVATQSFQGGATITTGTVLLEDIERIEELMLTLMEDNKRLYLKEHFNKKDGIVLSFPGLLSLEVNEFITTSTVGESATFVDGKISATINYAFIKRKDLLDAADQYLEQRPSPGMKLYDYDTASVTFFELRETQLSGHFLVPTKMNIIRGYDFEQDINNIADEVISSIVGLSKEQAREIILQHPEILDVTISLSPPWYETLPAVSSRISLATTNK